jgi:cysteine synthase A
MLNSNHDPESAFAADRLPVGAHVQFVSIDLRTAKPCRRNTSQGFAALKEVNEPLWVSVSTRNSTIWRHCIAERQARRQTMASDTRARITDGRGRLFDSVLDTIGDTPCVRVNNLGPDHVRIYVKIEAFNPAASVKDRLALNIIEAAERDGALKPGQTVVEATSGNTGIGLAMVCAQKGYPLVVTMADSFSIERRKLMRMFGAKVVLTPRAQKGLGMYRKAVELAQAHGWFLARQFETEANAQIHATTTAREILGDFKGERLDYFVTGYGTGGTLTGVGRVLRRERPETKIILSEPANAQLIGSGQVQERGADGSPAVSHPAFEPHPIQGWTPDFIPLVLQEAIDNGYYDQLVPVSGADGIKWARALAQKEGILTGISGGSTFAVSLRVAEKAEPGSVILCMLPDTGERYLTTPLFEGIADEMNEEELSISRSTPGFQVA